MSPPNFLFMPRRIIALFAALALAGIAVAVPAAARPDRHPTEDSATGWWAERNGGSEPTAGTPETDSPQPTGADPDPNPDPDPRQENGSLPCTDDLDAAVRFEFAMPDDDRPATGFYAVPATDPVGLVVFSHGYGHSSFSWQEHAARVARTLNVVAVAMDGRGLTFLETEKRPGIPNTAGWPVRTGAEDGIAAAQRFEAACPTVDTIVNYGVSMGGNTSGIMAAAGATRADGSPLFDWWIDVEGVNNLAETYLEARLASAGATRDIEAETGGPIDQRPDEFTSRTNVLRADDMKAAGLKGVVLVHGVDDGLVPHNQSQEMFAALTAIGIPAQFFVVTLKSDESERETTATAIVLNHVDGNYRSPLAGHASEMSTTHIVSVTGFERLDAIFGGAPPACTRLVVTDGQAGSTPMPDC